MSEYIEHEGVVLSREGENVRVRILQTSACSSCQARSMCVSSESKEKVIEARVSEADIRMGDEVVVMVRERMGWKAVGLAYVLPFVFLMAMVLVGALMKMDELMTGVVALGVVTVYYCVLALFRRRLGKQFEFGVRKKG